ncbi:hypothetical protein CDCA_CDCA02G0587 [Cyanidium caldarium]|uniref:DNA polymerase delta subunit 4 n=1 Tax=Cyanidium caldarium TaxID=2771 RepID=A0AAV9IQP4_CYACA|nr:hypothetical protein CDCA_CDCA02G0587 [Cyanidium caldarium]
MAPKRKAASGGKTRRTPFRGEETSRTTRASSKRRTDKTVEASTCKHLPQTDVRAAQAASRVPTGLQTPSPRRQRSRSRQASLAGETPQKGAAMPRFAAAAPRISQAEGNGDSGTSVADEDALRAFDLNVWYGPCVGLSRLERWARVEELGLHPPLAVQRTLDAAAKEVGTGATRRQLLRPIFSFPERSI